MGKTLLVLALGFICSVSAFADEGEEGRDAACNIPASVVNHVQSQLATVVQLNNGAIFGQIFPGPNEATNGFKHLHCFPAIDGTPYPYLPGGRLPRAIIVGRTTPSVLRAEV